MHFLNTISYLQHGTIRQQQAFYALSKNLIMEKLVGFTPTLAGTIPLNIDIENSDLDILCYWQDEDDFVKMIHSNFRDNNGFTIKQTEINGQRTVIANFLCKDFEVEIFGQGIPVMQQMGYLHMLAEYKILQKQGDEFRQQVIALKSSGYKTEPAFAKLLNLNGDPYIAILQYRSI